MVFYWAKQFQVSGWPIGQFRIDQIHIHFIPVLNSWSVFLYVYALGILDLFQKRLLSSFGFYWGDKKYFSITPRELGEKIIFC